MRRGDFRVLATTAGLRSGDADAAMEDMLRRIGGAIDGIGVPHAIRHIKESEKLINDVLDICRRRVEAFA